MALAFLIPILSFVACPLIILFQRWIPGRGAPVAILAILGGFVLWALMTIGFLGASPADPACAVSDITGALTCHFSTTWFQAGIPGVAASVDDAIHLDWGILIDPLTIVLLGLITFVALGVQIYSLEYMKGDPRFGWYYAWQALFVAAMLTLALADNFLLLYIAWELVGLCSYLLIGFWFENPGPREAAKKAFVVTRIGDVGLLVGILLIWLNVGSFSMTDAFAAVESGAMGSGTTTAVAILLLLGAMGKSAQFPFHVWLPDAMEGPTPVSALIHAATMVIAGVYLVARAFPIFSASPEALMVIASVGMVTALGAATIALVSTDLKRILAYSTVSHLGLMMLSLGALGWTAAVFHLMAHGFAKALLFLGAGSVMHGVGAHGDVDIRRVGGLRKAMPLTAVVFSIGALSLGGIPILSGFWSKDEILLAVSHELPVIFIVLAFATAFLSALYMARAMFIVFFGPEGEDTHHAHESPLLMTGVLSVLAVLAVGFGWIAFNWPGSFGGFGSFVYYDHAEGFHFNVLLGALSIVLAVGAFALAWLVYVRRAWSHKSLRARLAPVLRVVERRYYVDETYQWFIDRIILTVSAALAFFDRAVVNDVGINGPGDVVRKAGVALRLHVTGHVYSYALVVALGVIALAVFWWLRSV
ncbi:MAG: NADH-quinone oxidoreductase subunit L [Chloroflexi bacterium]|nr:NADH-quinone oxidoreductase subunit L [Chloroflexota bacterium]